MTKCNLCRYATAEKSGDAFCHRVTPAVVVMQATGQIFSQFPPVSPQMYCGLGRRSIRKTLMSIAKKVLKQ